MTNLNIMTNRSEPNPSQINASLTDRKRSRYDQFFKRSPFYRCYDTRPSYGNYPTYRPHKCFSGSRERSSFTNIPLVNIMNHHVDLFQNNAHISLEADLNQSQSQTALKDLQITQLNIPIHLLKSHLRLNPKMKMTCIFFQLWSKYSQFGFSTTHIFKRCCNSFYMVR